MTDCALKLQNRLLRGLGLLVEYRPGLTSLSSLLHVVSSLAQCRFARLPSLVEHDLVFGVVLACRAERVFSLGNAYHCALLVDFLISTQLLQCGCKYKSEGALICSTTEKSAQNRPCFFRFFPQHEEKFTSNFSRRGMGDRAFAGWEYSKKFVLLQHHRHPIIRHLPH